MPDFKKFFKPGAKGVTETNKMNVHGFRALGRMADLKAIAEKKMLSTGELLNAGDAIGQFKAAQSQLGKSSPAEMSMIAKFTKSASADKLKAAGVKPGSTFGEIASATAANFEKILGGGLKEKIKAAAEELKSAAKAGDKISVDAMKSNAFKALKSAKLIGGAIILEQVLPDIGEIKQAVEKAKFSKEGA